METTLVYLSSTLFPFHCKNPFGSCHAYSSPCITCSTLLSFFPATHWVPFQHQARHTTYFVASVQGMLSLSMRDLGAAAARVAQWHVRITVTILYITPVCLLNTSWLTVLYRSLAIRDGIPTQMRPTCGITQRRVMDHGVMNSLETLSARSRPQT